MSASTSTMNQSSLAGGSTSFLDRNADVFASATSLLNTGVSAYASYQSSIIKSNMMKIQARQQELQSKQERLKGVQHGNILREQLLNNLSSATAIFSARGVDVRSRSATALAARNISKARRDIDTSQANAEIRADGADTSAAKLR